MMLHRQGNSFTRTRSSSQQMQSEEGQH